MNSKTKIAVISVLSVLLAGAILVGVMFGIKRIPNDRDGTNTSSSIAKKEPLNIPADFNRLREINSDIYAWIYVPNTNIDYPILQHSKNDGFYLHHNIYGKYEFAGTIYSEKANNKNFSDPNTVLYGHNMTKGYMFENLHKFQDKSFFEENTEFYIYTPDKIYTYAIVSAFQHNDYHIMYEYDCTKESGFQKFIDLIKNPKYKLKNVREEQNISINDKFVTLSTCLGNGKVYRYLVVGVLTDVKNIN